MDKHDILHVARPGSYIFERNSNQLKVNSIILIEFLVKYGVSDEKRTPGGARMYIGCGGRCWDKNGKPLDVVGSITTRKDIPDKEKQVFCAQVGILVKFIWDVMVDMQMLSGKPPMSTTSSRKEFSDKLCKILYIAEVHFEDVTISVMTLYPECMQTKSHLDEMNAKLYCFSKTGTLDLVLEDSNGNIYLLQVSIFIVQIIDYFICF